MPNKVPAKQVIVWTIIIGLTLSLCLVLVLLFSSIYQAFYENQPAQTPTSEPTFTSTPTATIAIAAEIPPPTNTPTTAPVDTATPLPSPTPMPTASHTPIPVIPQVEAASTANIRSGPGTNYPVIASLSPGIPLPVIGQNENGSWWQIRQENNTAGWVADSVVEAKDTAGVPIVQTPPPPKPTNTPIPPQPTKPIHQFEPTGWYADTNRGLTRFYGTITDANGNPVDGVTVETRCGTYRIISNPSGPVPAFDSNDSVHDPPGFYDITVDKRPIPCKWQLTVVYTEDGKNALSRLSETFEVEVTPDKSIVVANWRKNW